MKNYFIMIYNIEYYVSIPYGKKYLAWFKNFYGKNNLYLLEINKKKYIQYNYQKNNQKNNNNSFKNNHYNNRNYITVMIFNPNLL